MGAPPLSRLAPPNWALSAVLCAALGLAACAPGPAGPPPARPAAGAEALPARPIELGEYATETEARTLAAFSASVARRYASGAPMAPALADLEANKFACARPRPGAGDPPDQVCRRVVKAEGCKHTFQVHLFDDDGAKQTLARVRGLYDKSCGGDDLLGG